jgi:hypothetical protein
MVERYSLQLGLDVGLDLLAGLAFEFIDDLNQHITISASPSSKPGLNDY